MSPGYGSSQWPVPGAGVERMLGDTVAKVKHESNKAVWVGVASLAAILVVGGGLFFYLSYSSAQDSAQAQQNRQLMKEMDQAVQKAPAATESMRQEVIRLEKEVKAAEAPNEKSVTDLEEQLAAQKIALQLREQRNELDQTPPLRFGNDSIHDSQQQPQGRQPDAQPAQQLDYDGAVRQLLSNPA
jgi:hypothetical protein